MLFAQKLYNGFTSFLEYLAMQLLLPSLCHCTWNQRELSSSQRFPRWMCRSSLAGRWKILLQDPREASVSISLVGVAITQRGSNMYDEIKSEVSGNDVLIKKK
ncbi:OLC1v1019402C1 [Oldenlandia corymbosa var. corymbosa]|uniref:OLC1v1019402C1 n=1 Tax=Oldenlandia corymbosa var. corymbosa TaxID=529605 RepID=A0AAV1EDV6_OLDCO|nr:OLC1v1019402C1 [Oldenlandia corymbosa var. corymbosa]